MTDVTSKKRKEKVEKKKTLNIFKWNKKELNEEEVKEKKQFIFVVLPLMWHRLGFGGEEKREEREKKASNLRFLLQYYYYFYYCVCVCV